MIDLDPNLWRDISFKDMSVLVLHTSANHYCTEPDDIVEGMRLVHDKVFVIDYIKRYKTLGMSGFNIEILEFIKKHNIQVIYFGFAVAFLLDLHFMERLRKQAFTVVYVDDAAIFFDPWFRYFGQAVDLIVSREYIDKSRFALYGIKCLFLSYCPKLITYNNLNVDINNKDINLSFIGRTDRLGRDEALTYLSANNLKVELFGAGTKNGLVTADKMIEVLCRSKIGLNFAGCSEHIPGAKINTKIRQTKGRILELMFCKALVMTEYSPYLEKLFKFDKEIIVFGNNEDLLNKASYYLKHADEREEIALNGHKKAIKDVNYKNVLLNLLKIIYMYSKEKTYRDGEIVIDNDYLEIVATHRMFCLLDFIRAGKYLAAKEEFGLILKYRRFNLKMIARELWAQLLSKNQFLKQIYFKIRCLR